MIITLISKGSEMRAVIAIIEDSCEPRILDVSV
jgi:hypothetical protein